MNWRSSFVVIDTETTGTDPARDRVVEVAALRSDGETFHRLINPRRCVGEAAAIHGITDDMLRDAPTFDSGVSWSLSDFISGSVCVAFNARFDRGMLIAEYLRAGHIECPEWLHAGRHWIDPLVWARARDPYAKGTGRFRLGAVAERLGVTPGTAHRALGDCETTARVLEALAPTMPEDFDELIMKQRILAAENEASFLKWLAKQPKREAA